MIENTAFDCLGDLSCYTCAVAPRRFWDALGVSDSMGFSQFAHASHCQFPPEQAPELNAYNCRFLLEGAGDTDVLKTDGGFSLDEPRWVDWN